MVRFRLCITGISMTEWCCIYLSGDTHFQIVPLLMIFTFITWLRYCLPGFSAAKLLFSLGNLYVPCLEFLCLYILFFIKLPIYSFTYISLDSFLKILFNWINFIQWFISNIIYFAQNFPVWSMGTPTSWFPCPDMFPLFFEFLNSLFIFYQSIVDLKYCINFRCTTVLYIYIFSDSFPILVIVKYVT